jgi:hypothetical protein
MTARAPFFAAACLATVSLLTLSGCLENRTVKEVTLEVDNTLGVFNISSDTLNSLCALNLVDMLRLRRKQIVVDSVGGETIFVKILSDVVTPEPNRFLGEGQTHTVTCSWRFREGSGTIKAVETFRGSSIVSRFVGTISGLTSSTKEVEIPPEFRQIVEDLNNELIFAVGL